MKRFSVYMLAVSMLTIFLASELSAQARQRMMMHRGDQERMDMRLGEQLNLSDEQKDKISGALVETRKKNIDVEAKQKLGRIELHELLTADAPDQKKIDAQISVLSQLHETIMRTRIESLLSIQKILTPEQRKKARELRLFERFHAGPGPGMPGPMGCCGGMGMGMHRPDGRF